MKKAPLIFSVNYFLKDKDGNFLNEKTDKRVWYKWMELRSHNEVSAIKTPTGLVPKYEDLKRLFKEVLKKDYSREAYDKQFMLRVPESLAKIERIKKIYENKSQIPDAPELLFRVLEEQKVRLMQAKEKFGDYITPDKFLS